MLKHLKNSGYQPRWNLVWQAALNPSPATFRKGEFNRQKGKFLGKIKEMLSYEERLQEPICQVGLQLNTAGGKYQVGREAVKTTGWR